MSARRRDKMPAMSAELAVQVADMLSLPFVVADRDPPPDGAGRRGFWRDGNTGDWGLDNDTGVAWARRLYEHYARHPGAEVLLPWIVQEMVSLGKWGGVEVGFLDAIDLAASGRCRRGGGPS